MKIKLIFLLFIFNTTIVANESITHDNFCSYNCSESQRNIVNQFDTLNTFQVDQPTVYSGECFHYANDFDGVHAHHGVVLLDNENTTWFMRGNFSFFYNEDPYQDWQVTDAREKLDLPSGSSILIFKNPNEAMVDFSMDEIPWIYWLRTDEKGNLYILSYWSLDHKMTCFLPKHETID